jgi:hypothetical protein
MKEPDEIFKKHFEQFRHGLTSASLKYYLETGSVSGSLLLGVRAMFKDWDEQNSHKYVVMQAEVSDVSEGAAVGNSAAGQSGSAWCSCEMPIPDMSYTCFKCGKMIDFERGGSAKGALPRES